MIQLANIGTQMSEAFAGAVTVFILLRAFASGGATAAVHPLAPGPGRLAAGARPVVVEPVGGSVAPDEGDHLAAFEAQVDVAQDARRQMASTSDQLASTNRTLEQIVVVRNAGENRRRVDALQGDRHLVVQARARGSMMVVTIATPPIHSTTART